MSLSGAANGFFFFSHDMLLLAFLLFNDPRLLHCAGVRAQNLKRKIVAPTESDSAKRRATSDTATMSSAAMATAATMPRDEARPREMSPSTRSVRASLETSMRAKTPPPPPIASTTTTSAAGVHFVPSSAVIRNGGAAAQSEHILASPNRHLKSIFGSRRRLNELGTKSTNAAPGAAVSSTATSTTTTSTTSSTTTTTTTIAAANALDKKSTPDGVVNELARSFRVESLQLQDDAAASATMAAGAAAAAGTVHALNAAQLPRDLASKTRLIVTSHDARLLDCWPSDARRVSAALAAGLCELQRPTLTFATTTATTPTDTTTTATTIATNLQAQVVVDRMAQVNDNDNDNDNDGDDDVDNVSATARAIAAELYHYVFELRPVAPPPPTTTMAATAATSSDVDNGDRQVEQHTNSRSETKKITVF